MSRRQVKRPAWHGDYGVTTRRVKKSKTETPVPTHRAQRPNHQWYDEVSIVTVPRYKTSDASGDEWRIHGQLQFKLKGVVQYTDVFRNVETALVHAPSLALHSEGWDFLPVESNYCDQEGCNKPPVITYKMKQEFTKDRGLPYDPYRYDPVALVRKFCDTHKTRGNCGLEDSDRNYVKL